MKSAFRKRSLASHPDRGGKESDFIDLVLARDFLLEAQCNRASDEFHLESFCKEAARCIARGLRERTVDVTNIAVDIKHAMAGSIFIHLYRGRTFAVPLWLRRSTFDVPGGVIVVNVDRTLNFPGTITDNNDLILATSVNITELVRTTAISIALGGRTHIIEIGDCPLLEDQRIVTGIVGLPAVSCSLLDDEIRCRRQVFLDLKICT